MRTTVLLLNLGVSLASAAWGVVALVRPASLSGARELLNGQRFYAHMYAARAIPFEFASGILPLCTRGSAVLWLLFTAAFIQFLDIVIAYGKEDRKMMLGAGVGTAVHLACAVTFL